MAVNLLSHDPSSDDDYIDMEVSSFTNFFSNSISSPPHLTEFEFQMNSSCLKSKEDTTTSPADELFYKGKLLPLHLPPRLQMVEKLLKNSLFEDFHSTLPLITNAVTTPTTTSSTPFESCNVSPAESCQVSRELNANEYLFEHSSEVSGFIADNYPKKSWTEKLKLIKQSLVGLKLKASSAYLKSLFVKSGFSDESCKSATKIADEDKTSKLEECFGNYTKQNQKGGSCHRRSFSTVIKRLSKSKTSSSSSSSSSSSLSGSSSASSSNDSNSSYELQFLKRTSSSAYSEIENSIQGAIAHCKQSFSPL